MTRAGAAALVLGARGARRRHRRRSVARRAFSCDRCERLEAEIEPLLWHDPPEHEQRRARRGLRHGPDDGGQGIPDHAPPPDHLGHMLEDGPERGLGAACDVRGAAEHAAHRRSGREKGRGETGRAESPLPPPAPNAWSARTRVRLGQRGTDEQLRQRHGDAPQSPVQADGRARRRHAARATLETERARPAPRRPRSPARARRRRAR